MSFLNNVIKYLHARDRAHLWHRVILNPAPLRDQVWGPAPAPAPAPAIENGGNDDGSTVTAQAEAAAAAATAVAAAAAAAAAAGRKRSMPKSVSIFARLMCNWNVAIRRMFCKLVVFQTFTVNRRYLPVESDRMLLTVVPPPQSALLEVGG